LDRLLMQFADADKQFTEEIEPFMNRARATLTDIRDATTADRTDDARAKQDEFAETYRAEVQRLKSTISDLIEAGHSLLTRL
ncbi:MAG: hypothetical protein ACRDSH_14965, partial [Pseudonocardiaceae bacterium]